MERDNKYQETSNLIIINKHNRKLKYNVHFMCVYVENTAMASSIK